jgi:high-affinity nickel-transport protein
VRKVYYNLAITALSVVICFFIGGIEALGLLPVGGFVAGFNINTAGFVIVGMFAATWVAAMLIWRFGRIEERWGGRLRPSEPCAAAASAAEEPAP